MKPSHQVSLSFLPLLTLAAVSTLATATPAQAGVTATGHDTIVASVGERGVLSAKFERSGWGFWRVDVRGRLVTFSLAGRTFQARTNEDGVARTSLSVTRPGVYPFEAWLSGEESTVATGRLWVLDPTRPVVVTDIDGTISDMPDWEVPLRGEKAQAFPHSPGILNALAKRHQVIYLTARDDTFDSKTRTFLARRGFPAGPVIYNDLGLWTEAERNQFDPKAHAAFKLAQIQKMGLKVALGIGNAETDAQAYEGAEILSYIRTDKTGSGASIRFLDYGWLEKRLQEDGHLPKTSIRPEPKNREGLVGSLDSTR